VKHWDIDFAARYEDYSDFGTKTTARSPPALTSPTASPSRAYSTGFRAPGLQQQASHSVAIQLPDDWRVSTPTEVITLPPSDPIRAGARAKRCARKTSDNYSVGFVFHQGTFELTVDGYQIKISDRIVLSET